MVMMEEVEEGGGGLTTLEATGLLTQEFEL